MAETPVHTLVTGRSGTGKSRLCRELLSLGQPAFDGDRIPSLAGWVDTATGLSTQVDYSKPIDKAISQWRWNADILHEFLRTHSRAIICGSADNDLSFFGAFDHVFVLDVPPDIQRARIMGRTEHDYGKLPAMQDAIVAEQQTFLAAALRMGAAALDATQPPAILAQQLQEQIA
jgi:broad-specificity NMP kinase